MSRALAKDVVECLRRGVLCWPVVKGSGLFFAGAVRGEDGRKVEECRGEQSRAESSHARSGKDSR